MPLSKIKKAEYMRERRKQKSVGLSVIPNWVTNPNRYLASHLRVCPDYNPNQPSDHFEHCPYVNPLLRPKTA